MSTQHSERTPLRDRPMRRDWSTFEAKLFNLITSDGPHEDWMLFSGRLRLAEAALRGIDQELALMCAEREAGMTGRI